MFHLTLVLLLLQGSHATGDSHRDWSDKSDRGYIKKQHSYILAEHSSMTASDAKIKGGKHDLCFFFDNAIGDYRGLRGNHFDKDGKRDCFCYDCCNDDPSTKLNERTLKKMNRLVSLWLKSKTDLMKMWVRQSLRKGQEPHSGHYVATRTCQILTVDQNKNSKGKDAEIIFIQSFRHTANGETYLRWITHDDLKRFIRTWWQSRSTKTKVSARILLDLADRWFPKEGIKANDLFLKLSNQDTLHGTMSEVSGSGMTNPLGDGRDITSVVNEFVGYDVYKSCLEFMTPLAGTKVRKEKWTFISPQQPDEDDIWYPGEIATLTTLVTKTKKARVGDLVTVKKIARGSEVQVQHPSGIYMLQKKHLQRKSSTPVTEKERFLKHIGLDQYLADPKKAKASKKR